MKISIIHPSRNRPEMAAVTVNNWLSKAKNASRIEYVISVDNDDNSFDEYLRLLKETKHKIAVMRSSNATAVEAINNAAKFTKGQILVVVSDDFDCPLHWDAALVEALDGKSDFIVKTKDGLQPFIITLPIMDRVYYERFGYIYYPGYKHMYCDTEMSCVGHMLGRTINLDILFPHKHYCTGAMQRDAINVKNDNTWSQGQSLFFERRRSNFGLVNPLRATPL